MAGENTFWNEVGEFIGRFVVLAIELGTLCILMYCIRGKIDTLSLIFTLVCVMRMQSYKVFDKDK